MDRNTARERPGAVALKRPRAPRTHASDPEVAASVASIIADVRERGDDAVREYALRFDRDESVDFRMSDEDIAAAVSRVAEQTLEDIRFVQEQVREMARHQLESLSSFEIETLPGVRLGQRNVPVDSVGAYVPGGRYPMVASAHMTIATAKAAGVARVVACTPRNRGAVPDATIAAMHLAGADEIHLLGGVQALAAMALGTRSIPRVDLIAGPGNAFVAEAKRQLFGEVGIDLLAGPTEVLIVADGTADPLVVAVDLLAQAEHGPDSPAVLVTTDEEVGRSVIEHVERLLPGMPTRENAEAAWRDHGEVQLVDSLDDAWELADAYAFEHVQVLTASPRDALVRLRHYGALFLGEGTCVAFGDKSIGTNHVLPTRGAARFTGGLWVGKFLRTTTYQEISDPSSSAFFGELTARAARVESFEGHARSGELRAAGQRRDELPWLRAAEATRAPAAGGDH